MAFNFVNSRLLSTALVCALTISTTGCMEGGEDSLGSGDSSGGFSTGESSSYETRDSSAIAVDGSIAVSDGETDGDGVVAPPTPDIIDTIQSGTLTAGDIDDNLNFDAFIDHINALLQADIDDVFPNIAVADRMTIKVVDTNGDPVSHARLNFTDENDDTFFEAVTTTAGNFYFLPTIDGVADESVFNLTATSVDTDVPAVVVPVDTDNLSDDRIIEIVLDEGESTLPSTLDLMFVIDTTGSMGDELNYITAEFESIIETVEETHDDVAMRFGLILYRDIGDAYVVREFDFTDSVDDMKNQLSDQRANGGGDYPEAMDAGLSAALDVQWSGDNSAKLLFLVADAPPHTENLQTTFDLAKTARGMGITMYPLAASGVADIAENLMRSMAAITHGRYLFLTDDSGVGNSHAEPSIPCYVATRLDNLISRVISSELSGERVEPESTDIIRMSGTYDDGLCIDNANE